MQSSGAQMSQSNQMQDEMKVSTHPTIIKLQKEMVLISFQLFIAVAACYATLLFVKQVEQLPKIIFWISVVVLIICLLFVLYQRPSSQISRQPINWTVYFVFLVAFAITVSCVVVFRQIDYFLMALVGMFFQTLAQFFYINSSKQELTYQGASIFIFGALLLQIQGFLVTTQISLNHVIIGTVFSVIWGFYLVFDSYTLQENYFWTNQEISDDYVSGAVSVYINIPILGLKVANMIRETIFKC